MISFAPSSHAMSKTADPSLFDSLWYFDSVVSSKPPVKGAKSRANVSAPAPAPAEAEDATSSCESGQQLPLSTGGEEAGSAIIYGDSAGGSHGGAQEVCKSCTTSRNGAVSSGSSPSMCELVERMEKDEGELPAKELTQWMKKLGLEYTADGAMIRRVQQPNTQLSSRQKLMDFSEFVCLNRFIEDERHTVDDCYCRGLQDSSFSDDHMASLYEIFQLFDRDDNGLISPSELRAALTKLGLCRNGSG